jgi:hypothetical protein
METQAGRLKAMPARLLQTRAAMFVASAMLLWSCSSEPEATTEEEPDVDAGRKEPPPSSKSDAGTTTDSGVVANPALDQACTPVVVLQVEDKGPGGLLFTNNVANPEAFVQETGRRVCRILYRKPEEVRAANKITLILRNDPSVAGWKSGDVGDITVMISTDHLTKVDGRGEDVKTEVEGVLVHEMTHMYQHDDKAPGEGTYPNLGNVIEGIADAVRIRAKLPPKGSKPAKTGAWDDEGYWKPAYFLLWVDGRHPDFLRDLNLSMLPNDGKAWTPARFETITGESVDTLWSAYAGATCCANNDRSCCE